METNCVKCCQAKKIVRKAKIPGEKMTRFHEFSNEDIGKTSGKCSTCDNKKKKKQQILE